MTGATSTLVAMARSESTVKMKRAGILISHETNTGERIYFACRSVLSPLSANGNVTIHDLISFEIYGQVKSPVLSFFLSKLLSCLVFTEKLETTKRAA